jgi:leader peptidase (prepilin peptidase)/N-methyltransferase
LNSLFIAVLIVLVFIDYQHQILPNILTVPGTVVGLLFSPFQDLSLYRDIVSFNLAGALSADDPQRTLPWVGSIFGALVGGGILLIVGIAYKAARKRQGLGIGDVKMMAMVGAFLGWRLALLTIFFGKGHAVMQPPMPDSEEVPAHDFTGAFLTDRRRTAIRYGFHSTSPY